MLLIPHFPSTLCNVIAFVPLFTTTPSIDTSLEAHTMARWSVGSIFIVMSEKVSDLVPAIRRIEEQREEIVWVLNVGGLEGEERLRPRVWAPPVGKVGERSAGRELRGMAERRVWMQWRIWDSEESGG